MRQRRLNSFLHPKLVFPAKLQNQESLLRSTLRSTRQIRISCLPLRSLHLRGEDAFQQLRSTRHLATLISCIGYSTLGVFSNDNLLPSLTLPAQKEIYADGITNYL